MVGVRPSGRYQHVDMGMVIERLSPSMEYRQAATLHSQEGGIGGRLLHRKGRRGKEHAVAFPLVEVKQGVEEFRDGEYYMKIPYREQPAPELFHPYKLLYILALGAVPVPAAVVARAGIATAVTGKGMASHFRGPAV